jgi:predicted Zn-dependent protease
MPLAPHRSAWRPAVVAVAALAAACASPLKERVELSAAKALISPEQAKQVSVQVQSQLEKEGVRFVDDPAVDGWVARVADPLFAVARKARPDLQQWRVHVIDDPKTVNAFATTGGDLYVYSGLVLLADDGAELAGVIAHEIGHVALYHVQRQMVDALGLEALTALALGQNPGAATQVAAAVGGKTAMLANSRGDEKQADEWGVVHADEAGYDPGGLVRFFRKLQAQEGKTPQALGWLSDHPATPARISDTEALIRDRKLHATGTGPGGLDAVKAALRSRPAPPPAQSATGGRG